MATDWLMPSEDERKQQSYDDKEELFVFGYACKVFKDDEKATFIDQGQHLIPWMGDDRLMIDRYDGRGHLYDLSRYDASNVKATEITDDERQMEQLCDEERYLELRTDVAEKVMYEEEEWKRYYESLSEGYNAVGFSYDYQQQQEQYAQQKLLEASMEAEKPFLVPSELQLPPDIKAPDTEKVNAIIEKTAKFVAKQGMQMEIIVKTKQANNAQFNFLHYDDELHPYYKHMVTMIKSGKYKPKEEESADSDDQGNEDEDYHGYLHPSLLSRSKAAPAPSLAPDVPLSKPIEMPKVSIHDTPYGQLVKTLAKKHQPQETSISTESEMQDASRSGTRNQTPPPPPLKPPPIPPYLSQPEYGPAHPGLPPPPGLEPVTLPIPTSNQPPPPGTDLGPVLSARISPAFDEDSNSRDSPVTTLDQIIPPPPDVQPVIDRMAMYVAKNGIEFEIVVKSKKDPRFEFLESYHVHFPYYNFKKQIHMREAAKERVKKENEKPAKLSFSIKTKSKEQDSLPREKKKKVFDHESDEEGDNEYRERLSLSGTSTPLGSEGGFGLEEKPERPQIPPEEKEKKQAEERLKDRMAHAAREKLAQASREKQMQAERKRKAAMFINMLKSCNPGSGEGDEGNRDAESAKTSHVSTPVVTPSSSPGRYLDVNDSDNNTTRSSKRSRESVQGSRSRSRSPRRKRYSPAPPSTYNALGRSQSPQRGNRTASPPRRRDRSKSPRSKRSRSPSYSSRKSRILPSSSRDKEYSSRSSHKSKKKKKSRSRSRSPGHSSRSRQKASDPDVIITGVTKGNPNPESSGNLPVSIPGTTDRSICRPNLGENGSTQSVSSNRLPPIPESEDSVSVDNRLSPMVPDAEDSNSAASDSRSCDSPKNVSNYMLHRVRALIKASRQAILKEDGPLYDDT